jgi:hypothetical protein
MNVVNDLLQNIRFLKFYGWGELGYLFDLNFIIKLYRVSLVSERSDGQRNGTEVACKRKHSRHCNFLHIVECFLIYSFQHYGLNCSVL